MRIDLDNPLRGHWRLEVEFRGKLYPTRAIDADQVAALREAIKSRPFPGEKVRELLGQLFKGERRPELSAWRVDQLMEVAAAASMEFFRVDFHRAARGHLAAIERAARP